MISIACLRFLILLNIVYMSIYIKLGLVVDITKQILNGKEVNMLTLVQFRKHAAR